MLRTRHVSACALLIAGCAAPGGEARARDTLVIGAAPSTTNVQPLTVPVTPDSTVHTLNVFTGFTQASGNSPPELALVAADGRQIGYDPSTHRYLAQIPGASYDSSATVDDDDDEARHGEPLAAQAIDSRELNVPTHPGESYTLVVTAADPGVYVLYVSLYPGAGNQNVGRRIENLALTAGEPRRFAIRVGQGTMEMTP